MRQRGPSRHCSRIQPTRVSALLYYTSPATIGFHLARPDRHIAVNWIALFENVDPETVALCTRRV